MRRQVLIAITFLFGLNLMAGIGIQHKIADGEGSGSGGTCSCPTSCPASIETVDQRYIPISGCTEIWVTAGKTADGKQLWVMGAKCTYANGTSLFACYTSPAVKES